MNTCQGRYDSEMLETKNRCRPEASHSTISALIPNIISPPSPSSSNKGLPISGRLSTRSRVSHASLSLSYESAIPSLKATTAVNVPHQSKLLRRSVIPHVRESGTATTKEEGAFGLFWLGPTRRAL